MAKMKELDNIARGVADITKELMYDSIDWQLSDYPQDGDMYNEIHSHVMMRAITMMYEDIRTKHED
tara:strand:+ start:30 stop:227 length:198 start_codon:yes stop_codon:yes gene_type:complete